MYTLYGIGGSIDLIFSGIFLELLIPIMFWGGIILRRYDRHDLESMMGDFAMDYVTYTAVGVVAV